MFEGIINTAKNHPWLTATAAIGVLGVGMYTGYITPTTLKAGASLISEATQTAWGYLSGNTAAKVAAKATETIAANTGWIAWATGSQAATETAAASAIQAAVVTTRNVRIATGVVGAAVGGYGAFAARDAITGKVRQAEGKVRQVVSNHPYIMAGAVGAVATVAVQAAYGLLLA